MEKETVDKLTCRKSITNFYDDKNLVTPETLKSTKTKKKSGKWVYLSSSETEEDLVTNYGNLLTTVESDILTLVIEKYENKVSLKIYTNYKLRTRGNRFFVKRKKVGFLTVSISERRFDSDTKFEKYYKVSGIEIQPLHRNKGFGKTMYNILIEMRGSDIKGLYSYLPDRVNKKQIPSIYKRYNTITEGDYEIIIF